MSITDRLAKLSEQVGITALGILLGASVGWADEIFPRSAAPAEARVAFISPTDGAIVRSPITVQSALTGIAVMSADDPREPTATLHLMIDAPLPNTSLPIPIDKQHHHFGVDQTGMNLELEPGLHTLQLVMGDADHVPHGTPVASEPVSIIVTNLEVKKLGYGDNWARFELASDLAIHWSIDPGPFEEDFEGRRARLEERARINRLLEMLVEDIRRAKRKRAASQTQKQRQTLTLEVEDPPEP